MRIQYKVICVVIYIITITICTGWSTPIVEYPMVATHNSATSYLSDGLVNRWVKCQSKSIYEQLLCGVRFLFLSVTVVGDKLVMSHGAVLIPVSFDDVVDEIVRFTRHYPESLVFVDISKCFGANCNELVRNYIEVNALGQWIDSSEGCFSSGITYHQLKEMARIHTGGSIVFVHDQCVRENWVPDIGMLSW